MSVTAPKSIARYQVISHIETGGMGSVFLARDPAIDRLVAIKLLREGFDNSELRARFVREARAAGRLKHVNIVTIFDVGVHGNQPFIAMEYVEGETLWDLIRRNAPLSLGRKLQLMDELSAGLQFAHRAGIVHRDIKPKNIMVDRDGILKVLDFGIARVGDDEGGPKTQAGMQMGTLNYMAPEQMMGLPDLDARADIFAAGAVFYELLAYRQAFPGGLENGIVYKITQAPPDALQGIDPLLDPAVIELVNRCLDKSREERFPDMVDVRRQLALLKRRYPVDEDEDLHNTIRVPRHVVFPDPSNQRTPKSGGQPRRNPTERNRLRAEQIGAHLEDGRAAFARGDFTGAFDASQGALLLDDNNADALDLEHRARTALDELQLAEWLAAARNELARGALTSALALVDQALGLNASSSEAEALRAKVDEARRQLAEAQERARAIAAALAQARTALSAGALEDAFARVNDALALDEQNADAVALRRDVEAALEARRHAADEARAGTALKAARDQFAAGDRTEAIAALERFEPAALVADVLSELRVEFKEMERLRIEAERQAEERRKAVEAAEHLRKATARTLDDAAARLAAQDLDGARALTHELLQRQPEHSEARALDARIEQAIELRRQVAAGVATAKEHVDAERFEEARRAITAVETLDAAAPEIVTLRRAADAGIRAAELEATRQREADERRAKEFADVEAKAGLRKQREAEVDAAEEAKNRIAGRLEETLVLTKPVGEPTVVVRPRVPEPGPDPRLKNTEPDRDPAAPRGPRPWMMAKSAALAGVAIGVVALTVWMRGSGSTTQPIISSVENGTVVLDILPWANIESITRKADGQPVQSGCAATPCVVSLPAGEYHVRASNPNFPGALEFEMIVIPSGLREEHRALPEFRAEDEVSKIVGGGR